MGQLFLIAVRNLLTHRRRTLMLGGAIAGVTALLLLVLGLTHGVNEMLVRSATTVMTGHLNVGGFYKVTSGSSAPVVTDYKNVEAIIRKEIPEVAAVVNRGRGFARVISDSGSQLLVLSGIDIDDERGFRETVLLKEGRFEDLARRDAILLFENQAEKLGVRVGDRMTLSAPTPRGVNNTLDVQVVAIARSIGLMSTFMGFLNNEGLRSLYQLNDRTTGALQIYLHDINQVDAVKPRLREVLSGAGFKLMDEDPRSYWMKFEAVNREGWTGQKLDVTTWKDETSFMSWTLTLLNALSFFLIFVLLVIISVGVMNALWIAIRERTREVGTLRAIGMQRTRVLAMFVIEGFVLGLSGTTLGAAVGLVVAALLNAVHLSVPVTVQLFVMSDTLRLAVVPAGVVGSIALITFCTTFISLFPSFLAARMKPITAMHHIG
ncbi:MAG TPA: FtsX-like permease family protein [Myxococcaceae bacterium]|nr:FtsX-like permease family protein [Myxococcaceae bacterium]